MGNNSIGLFIFTSIGSMYEIANQMYTSQDDPHTQVEILEMAPLSTKAYLLLRGNDAALLNIKNQSSPSISHASILIDPHKDLVPSYLGLTVNKAKSYLLIHESQDPGQTFQDADFLLKNGFCILDLRILRNDMGNAYMIATSEEIPTAVSSFISSEKVPVRKFTLIQNISKPIKELF